ncbi:MAG TPA: hypothetical protein VHL80_17445 [Polyangia bacterium]|nr:hypothetical protein [Polyangia bacterium]
MRGARLVGAVLARRAGLAAALVLGGLALGGCPLQTPSAGVVTPGLSIEVSSGAPLVNDTITLTAMSAGGVDLGSATWTASNPQILSLSASKGASISATALKSGLATVTVTAGALRGAVAITVLDSIGDVAIQGPTSMTKGTDATYTATVTDATGRTVNAAVAWVVSPPGGGVLALATPGSNTGSSIQVHAAGVGDGAVTAAAGGRAAQVAVKVAATSGTLVITSADGTPVPTFVAVGSPLTVQASYEATSELAADARWTATGTCMPIGTSGASVSVEPMGSGTCTLTASAKGMQATATFQIVSITDVEILGDGTTPLAVGDTRTFNAVGLAGTMETGAVAVTWSTGGPVLSLQPGATAVKVTGTEIGTATLTATVSGAIMKTIDVTVAPASIKLAATGARVLAGAGTTLTAAPLDAGGKTVIFASADGVTVAGATGFGSVGVPTLQTDGTVTVALGDAKADSAAVTVSFGGVTSNALAFTVAQIATVVVMGPQGPIRMGSSADFTAVPTDGMGARIDGDVAATWTDSTGVYQFPAANGTLLVTANAVKLGTSAIVATVGGISSTPYASPVQPASIGITAFSPTSIAVGGTATTTVTVLDAGGQPIPGVPLSQVSLMADDGTKVSFDAGAVVGAGATLGYLFTATGLAATPAKGVSVQATWTDGMYPVQSTQVPLVVTP